LIIFTESSAPKPLQSPKSALAIPVFSLSRIGEQGSLPIAPVSIASSVLGCNHRRRKYARMGSYGSQPQELRAHERRSIVLYLFRHDLQSYKPNNLVVLMLDRQEQQAIAANSKSTSGDCCLATGENMKISILGEKWIGRRGKGVYCLNMMS
jgi:hypothetical protein